MIVGAKMGYMGTMSVSILQHSIKNKNHQRL